MTDRTINCKLVSRGREHRVANARIAPQVEIGKSVLLVRVVEVPESNNFILAERCDPAATRGQG